MLQALEPATVREAMEAKLREWEEAEQAADRMSRFVGRWWRSKMLQRDRRGQPKAKHMIEHLLEKIQASR